MRNLNDGVVLAHEHIGVDAPRRIRALAQHLGRMQQQLHIIGRARGVIGERVVAAGCNLQHRITGGRAVAHGRVGNAVGILGARPERTTGRAHVVFVQRARTLPALVRTMRHLTLGVAMAT
ncbi:hypothetical protein AZ54_11605 [Xanthomonas oryzae pv. oryzae PXO86]|nr:hypothetical protein AZ54_11605 [Xanthomonas oryzae pv. oryzae PXO86]